MSMQVLVKLRREALGLSQREFAPLIELNHWALLRREKDPDRWSLSELERCCHFFGTSLCALVILDPPPQEGS